jgi:hypothetical protein
MFFLAFFQILFGFLRLFANEQVEWDPLRHGFIKEESKAYNKSCESHHHHRTSDSEVRERMKDRDPGQVRSQENAVKSAFVQNPFENKVWNRKNLAFCRRALLISFFFRLDCVLMIGN